MSGGVYPRTSRSRSSRSAKKSQIGGYPPPNPGRGVPNFSGVLLSSGRVVLPNHTC